MSLVFRFLLSLHLSWHHLQANAIPQREADAQRSSYVQLSARAKMAEAAKREAGPNLEYATVLAPVSGRIGRMLVTPDNLVSASNPLANLVSINPLHVYVDVEDFAAHGLRSGVKATVNVDGAGSVSSGAGRRGS